jgi:hypothetical protein
VVMLTPFVDVEVDCETAVDGGIDVWFASMLTVLNGCETTRDCEIV